MITRNARLTVRLSSTLAVHLIGIVLGLSRSVACAEDLSRGASARFTDPFQYCAAVGSIDAPDQRYIGPPMPETIARGLQHAFGAPSSAPLTPFLEHSFWRCMERKVYACTVGANIPCQSKADVSRTPNQGMLDFCHENPSAEVIPAVATGRETIYAWRCREGAPEIVQTLTQPDARGFLAHIWHEIAPPAR